MAKKWIQKATASIKKRKTKGVCTGKKFGSKSCPFKKMARKRKAA